MNRAGVGFGGATRLKNTSEQLRKKLIFRNTEEFSNDGRDVQLIKPVDALSVSWRRSGVVGVDAFGRLDQACERILGELKP